MKTKRQTEKEVEVQMSEAKWKFVAEKDGSFSLYRLDASHGHYVLWSFGAREDLEALVRDEEQGVRHLSASEFFRGCFRRF